MIIVTKCETKRVFKMVLLPFFENLRIANLQIANIATIPNLTSDHLAKAIANSQTYGWKKEHISFAKFEDKGVDIKRWKHCNNVLGKESKWAHP